MGGEVKIATNDWEAMPINDSDDGSKGRYGRKGGAAKLGVMAAGALMLWIFLSLRTVPPANIGLSVTLGSVSEGLLQSGIHMMNPLSLCRVVQPQDAAPLLRKYRA